MTKMKSDGTVYNYKSRLVAKSYHQRPGIGFVDTFSPVVRRATIRILLSVVVSQQWHVTQLDISNTFLRGHLDEVVYMSQPLRFIDPTRPEDHVCLLKRSLYGLKQAPHMWNKCLTYALLSYGFSRSKADCSLFYFISGPTKLFCLIYLDDILVMSNYKISIESVVAKLQSHFAVKDLG